MPTLQSDIAVQYANQLIGLAQQLKNVRAAVAEIVTVNSVTPLGNLFTVLNTTALASDGTLGTADAAGSPNSGHPIDPRVYPALSRAVKSGDLTNALQLVVDFSSFMAGSAISSNGARPANIDAVAM